MAMSHAEYMRGVRERIKNLPNEFREAEKNLEEAIEAGDEELIIAYRILRESLIGHMEAFNINY